jgi:polyphosphate glucokinase
VLDIGGTNVSVSAAGHRTREFSSGPRMTPDEMVAAVKRLTTGWAYDRISIGYPGPVARGRPAAEPHNLGSGWVGFDFSGAFGCPVRIVNDAALQALGSYRTGRMLYLGFGTGLGSALIVAGQLAPLELAHLPYREGGTYEDFVGIRGLERLGEERWRDHVMTVITLLATALQSEDTVVGGGNANRLSTLPPGARRVADDAAFNGGLRLWDEHRAAAAPTVLVEVHPTTDALMRAAAEMFARRAAEAIHATGRFAVALSGGGTPAKLYAVLAGDPFRTRVDWTRVEVFWSDERSVPPDHPASNYRLARELLLDELEELPAANVHRIFGEDDPPRAAASYERSLRNAFATPVGPPRVAPGSRFDLILLGLGEDGHTASLFPGSAAIREEARWVVAPNDAPSSTERITLTLPVINAAAEVAFLVSGEEKARTLQRVIEGPRAPELLPAQRVAPSHGRLRWLVDRAAASLLA